MLDVIDSMEGTGILPFIKTSTRINFLSTGRVGLDIEMLFQGPGTYCWVGFKLDNLLDLYFKSKINS